MVGQQIKDHLTQLSNQVATLEVSNDYLDIELTPEQTAEALRLGREAEYYRRRQEAYRRRLTEARTFPSFSSEQLMELLKMQYDVDQDNERVIVELCYYFSGDE